MKEFISGADLKAMMISAAANIDLNKQIINDLNVFPVPDGDTGTNMALTLGAAAKELGKAGNDITVSRAADITASALLRGARGNSGVITSLLFRGFSKSMKEKVTADGADFAAALYEGVEAAYKSVMKPAEGTILTVSRVSAQAALEACGETTDIEPILDVAIVSAKQALEETVNQNPVLKKAGVVDAGGKGFVLILEAMKAAMLGDPIVAGEGTEEVQESQVVVDMSNFTFTYDTVFIVRKNENCDLNAYGEYLNSVGDSLVIGEDDEIFKVHVHTDIPGEVLTEAAKYGVLELAKIENMRTQCEDQAAGHQAISTDDLDAVEEELEQQEAWTPDNGRKIAAPEKEYGVVSVCAGEGIAAMFRDLGVDQIVSGGQTMNPSTEDILKMIDATPAEVVFVLPNNKNIFMAAQQCEPLSEKRVVVIPTATVPQGVTAMLNMDVSASVEENVEAMTAAIEGVTTMQITYAARNSDFDGYAITEGDYLALCGGLFGTNRDIKVLLRGLAEKAKELDSEFITIFYGEDISEEDAQEAEAIFAEVCPDAEIALLSGGQPVYYYLISAE